MFSPKYVVLNFPFYHQGYIDASEDGFKKFADDGEELINSNHYASDEIKDKVFAVELFNFELGSFKVEFQKLKSAQITGSLLIAKLMLLLGDELTCKDNLQSVKYL